MGNVDSITYPRLPKAILTFGQASQSLTDLEKTQNVLDGLNDAVECINNSLELGGSFIKFLDAIKSYTGQAGTFISIVSYLIGKTDELQSKISELEAKLDTTDVLASLRVLKNIIEILGNSRTTSAQLLSEISFAIHEFHKLLTKFTGDSVLCIKYYLGAPLFVQICALFKAVLLFVKKMPDYVNPGLETIVNEYQETLNSFRIRCIRERCLSIYMYDTFFDGFGGGSDPKRLYEMTLTHFPNYFTIT